MEKRCSILGPTQSHMSPSILQYTKTNNQLHSFRANRRLVSFLANHRFNSFRTSHYILCIRARFADATVDRVLHFAPKVGTEWAVAPEARAEARPAQTRFGRLVHEVHTSLGIDTIPCKVTPVILHGVVSPGVKSLRSSCTGWYPQNVAQTHGVPRHGLGGWFRSSQFQHNYFAGM